MSLSNAYSILWTIFAVVWIIGWLHTKHTLERAPFASRLKYGIPVLIGSYLMFAEGSVLTPLYRQIIPRSVLLDWVALILTAAGIAIAIWARLYLGQNWSGAATIKVEHHLIRRGPYRWVRHPIYSGILLALLGTALGRGKIAGFVAVILFWIGLRIKSRMEEQFMRKTFGDEYIEYTRTTGALFPKFD
jgi:protein-S-isoprenylcysteine O-methyltransferase Ste14